MDAIHIRKGVLKSWLSNKSTPPRTIEELAGAINVSPSLLSLIMSGKRQITPNVQRKLCKITGYDVGDICFFDRNGKPNKNDKP